MDLKLADLNAKLAKIDKSLEEGWNYEEYRKRNILVHRIAVAESRMRGEWAKGEMAELRLLTGKVYID